jgi:hypothetical protein
MYDAMLTMSRSIASAVAHAKSLINMFGMVSEMKVHAYVFLN